MRDDRLFLTKKKRKKKKKKKKKNGGDGIERKDRGNPRPTLTTSIPLTTKEIKDRHTETPETRHRTKGKKKKKKKKKNKTLRQSCSLQPRGSVHPMETRVVNATAPTPPFPEPLPPKFVASLPRQRIVSNEAHTNCLRGSIEIQCDAGSRPRLGQHNQRAIAKRHQPRAYGSLGAGSGNLDRKQPHFLISSAWPPQFAGGRYSHQRVKPRVTATHLTTIRQASSGEWVWVADNRMSPTTRNKSRKLTAAPKFPTLRSAPPSGFHLKKSGSLWEDCRVQRKGRGGGCLACAVHVDVHQIWFTLCDLPCGLSRSSATTCLVGVYVDDACDRKDLHGMSGFRTVASGSTTGTRSTPGFTRMTTDSFRSVSWRSARGVGRCVVVDHLLPWCVEKIREGGTTRYPPS